jgi:DNA-binding transcriptional ArsR family regulator
VSNVSVVSNENFQPAPTVLLEDADPIRAYVHPTRMAILTILGRGRATASEVARELGVHPANLTRHFRLLEQTGLIRLVEKRDTGRNLAKYYRAAALAFEVRMHTDRIEDRRAAVLGVLRDNLSTAVATAKGERSGEVLGLLELSRLDRTSLTHLRTRLSALAKEFAALDSPDGVSYSLSLALYPNEVAPPITPEPIIGSERTRGTR